MGLWISKRGWRAGCLSLVAWAAFACLAAANPADADVQYYPALDRYGSVMFEDSFPSKGDFDFNDAVLKYHFEIHKDASGKLFRLVMVIRAVASGASFQNGLAVRFPLLASTPHLAKIHRQGEEPTVVTPVAGETNLVFVLYDDIREAFPTSVAADAFINTQQGDPVRLGETLEFEVQFDPPLDFSLDPPFDPFIFRTGEYTRQIHLPSFGPTQLALEDPAIADLFGTEDDCSNQVCAAGDGSVVDNTGRWYVDNQGLPWAIDVPHEIQWPAEGKSIELAYPQFFDWATSGGETNTDWYLHGDPAYLYNLFLPPTVPGLLPGPAWVLLGVMAALGALRLRGRR